MKDGLGCYIGLNTEKTKGGIMTRAIKNLNRIAIKKKRFIRNKPIAMKQKKRELIELNAIIWHTYRLILLMNEGEDTVMR